MINHLSNPKQAKKERKKPPKLYLPIAPTIAMTSSVAAEQMHLSWAEFGSSMSGSFQKLRNNCELFDVTLACASEHSQHPTLIRAHKVILAASSPVLKHLMIHMDQNANGMLYLSGLQSQHLEAIVDFIYSGHVNVAKDQLDGFLKVAQELKVEGLFKEGNSGSASTTVHWQVHNNRQQKKRKRLESADDRSEAIVAASAQVDWNAQINPAFAEHANNHQFEHEMAIPTLSQLNNDGSGITNYFTHVEGVVYKCNICQKQIKTMERSGFHLLKQHFTSRHTVTERVECSICNKTYKNAHALSNHKYQYHRTR